MWTATSAGVTFGGDTLLVLQFTSTGGNTNLRWDTQTPGACNYVDPLGYNFPQYYQNGSIVVHELPVAAAVPAGPSPCVPEAVHRSIQSRPFLMQRLIPGLSLLPMPAQSCPRAQQPASYGMQASRERPT
jgi:hypothetical protein